MALNQKKYEHKHETILRDIRPLSVRLSDAMQKPSYSTIVFAVAAFSIYQNEWALAFADLIIFFMFLYFLWLVSRDRSLAFKLPLGSKYKDTNNGRNGKKGDSQGILYLGNAENTREEVWFTNSDIRTHILYLGTTGAGKTEGLKSLVTNALTWGSGFVYVDGKADTDLWSSLSSLVRRFGRDDDLLVLNYMTGNSNVQAPSNTMNPFSSGSSSYLTNMLVSLMPESGGDNAMWKERAVSLVGAMMPALTWKRDNQEIPLSVRTLRDYLSLNNVIKLSRDDAVPREVRVGLIGYLDTLPGFIGDAYDNEGKVKPPGADTPQYNTETASQQHGYLAMQFTRSLQSLGDDYGYIFDTQAADVDMVDVVLNRRILVVLVPALEKSGDEIANLGKIVSAAIKGMMGSTLGSKVEGSSEAVIENKPTHSSTPFMTIFDEVGYYVAEGMAVMAAQARSLGFSLVFAGQDLPALKKRVREEANSITANCNIKLFGKLEDPTETKDFFEKTVGSALVTEVSGFQMSGGSELGAYYDSRQAGVQLRPRASYDKLRGFKEGQAIITFGDSVYDCAVFYSNPGFAKAMRVTRFMTLPAPDETIIKHASAITKLRDLMVNKTWTAERADVAIETSVEMAALNDGYIKCMKKGNVSTVDAAIAALVTMHGISNDIPPANQTTTDVQPATTPITAAPIPVQSSPLFAQRPADIIKSQSSSTAPASSSAKPSIFGGAPAAPKQEAPQAPKETITTDQTDALVKAAQEIKQNLFGETKQANQSTSQATPAIQTTITPQKPSIFGGAPATPPAKPQETTPLTPVEGNDKLVKAAEDVKKNLFGVGESSGNEKPAETGLIKPSIFGGITSSATPRQEQGKASAPTPETPAPTRTEENDKLIKAAEDVKNNLFGSGESQEPPAQPQQSAPVKPAIFGGAPATKPQEGSKDNGSDVKKPAIFGGNTEKKSSDDQDDNQ